MKTLAVLLLIASAVLPAQQRPKLTINSETDEGKLLQQIELQSDETKKQVMLEQFVAKYPKHEGAPWVYRQLQPMYVRQHQFDRSLKAGSQALALDPNDLDASYNNLKAAEAKKDIDSIKQWALQTSQLARKNAAGAPADYAKQIDTYCEYSLYAAALQNTEPGKVLDLIETLEHLNPHSQYLPKAYGHHLATLRQMGQIEQAGAAAEKLADRDLASEDVLLIAADYNLQKKTQPDKVILYSIKLIQMLAAKPKPDGMGDAEWDGKKQSLSGLANWMAGITYSGQANYREADKYLREAVPHLTDEQVRAIGLFHLGLADYQLGKAGKNRSLMQDALKYSEQSAAIVSPLQVQAQKNVRAIRGELGSR
ncbi:MAG: hypothetical protein M3Z32_02245 [Acidobacteriota bacterium]|nr:hypothetical protein [Acidobacteriota bacterium]